MTQLDGVTQAQQRGALTTSTIAFTACFAVWTIFSILGVQIKQELGLTDTQFGLLVGTPILTGSLSRIFLGIWTDQYGGRIVYVAVMILAALATFLLSFADTYPLMLLAALGVGLAGGSFAVGIAYVSKWYPPGKQGTALGIFGVGNVGAAVTKFVAPFVLVAFGWTTVAQVWAAALLAMAAIFWFTTEDDPALKERRARGEKPRSTLLELEPLKNQQVWRFALYYFFVFGGFVALALWLPRYLIGVYELDIKTAGMLAAFYSIPASLFRAYGGHLSDRYGARADHVLDLRGLADLPVHAVLSGHRLRHPRHRRGHRLLDQHGAGAVRHRDLRAWLLHVAGQGGGLQAHPGLLSRPCRLGRRPGRHDRRAGRLHPADPVRPDERPDQYPDRHLHADVRPGRRHGCLDAHVDPPDGARCGRRRAGQAAAAGRTAGGPHGGGAWWQAGSGIDRLAAGGSEEFWKEEGHRIATRNLWISIPCLLLAFSVWLVWSVVVAKLPAIGFTYDTGQLFWLAALPGLSGATLRIFYSFMVPIFGGRLWTALTTASLIIPALGVGYAVQNPETPYFIFLVLALLCGFGGGNFASSMANISFFFPKKEKGQALAMNAGLGNAGVSVMQFAVPLVITAGVFGALGGEPQVTADGTQLWIQNAGFIWVPFLIVSTLLAWFGMNDIAEAKASFSEQAVIFQRKHNWIMCWLYTGTFGSFIGYSAGFPLLARTQFPEIDSLQYVFLGPLVGALSRAATGWISDKYGGGRVTFWVFWLMIAAVAGVLYFLGIKDQPGAFWGFFAMFMVLFFATGVGNASTFQMIPIIMRKEIGRLMPGAEPAGPAAQRGEGIRRDHRLHLGDRRLWRLLHPEILRDVDQRDRRPGGGALGLPDLLRHLRADHLVRLHPARRIAA